MFARSEYPRATSATIGDINRRLRSLEQRIDRASNRASTRAADATDNVSDAIASALAGIATRFRGDGGAISEEAARVGTAAAKLGGEALQRLSKEAERRPLVMLAVAVGVGILVGLVGHRR
jgi:ElaB/YqjD/DUF883 family membrane-anchored ribosome-binding protein